MFVVHALLRTLDFRLGVPGLLVFDAALGELVFRLEVLRSPDAAVTVETLVFRLRWFRVRIREGGPKRLGFFLALINSVSLFQNEANRKMAPGSPKCLHRTSNRTTKKLSVPAISMLSI